MEQLAPVILRDAVFISGSMSPGKNAFLEKEEEIGI